MSRVADYREKMITVGLPPLLVLLIIGLGQLPPDTLERLVTVLTAWTCTAIPIAVVFGHCVPGDD